MVDLTTRNAVKSVLNITETSDDSLIDLFVSQASQTFATETQRQFYDVSGATLTYDLTPPQIFGSKLFFLTDVLDVDRVINGDGNVITPTSFRLLPLNGSPKYALELYSGSNQWFQAGANGRQSAITIQGTTGYCVAGTIPADVTYAVTKLAAFYYQTRDNSGDVVKFADGTTVIPANAPAVVLRTVNNYMRVQMYT